MEVKPGYQRSIMGVIPKDWKCTTVGQLVSSGVIEKPLDGNHGNIHPKSSDFVSYGIPFVMANNIKGGHIDFSSCAFIRKKQADSLQKGFSITGDVLLTHKDTIGHTALVEETPFEYIMLTPQVTYYRVADPTRLSNHYLRHFFDSVAFQNVLLLMSGGGTRSYIGITAQLKLPVIIPSRPEQRAIATALSDVDALIAALDRLIAKKRDIKQAAMLELFTGKKRLPGFAGGKGYKQTEVGMIPEDWQIRMLGEISNIKGRIGWRGYTVDDLRDSGPLVIGATQINSDHKMDLSKPVYISKEKFEESPEIKINHGELLFVKTGNTIGKTALVDFKIGEATINPNTLIMRELKCDNKYLYQLLTSLSVQKRIWDLFAVGAQPSVNQEKLKLLRITFPPLPEQIAIAATLMDMDAEISMQEQRREKIRLIKQGKMQELLTGRIRLL